MGTIYRYIFCENMFFMKEVFQLKFLFVDKKDVKELV